MPHGPSDRAHNSHTGTLRRHGAAHSLQRFLARRAARRGHVRGLRQRLGTRDTTASNRIAPASAAPRLPSACRSRTRAAGERCSASGASMPGWVRKASAVIFDGLHWYGRTVGGKFDSGTLSVRSSFFFVRPGTSLHRPRWS